MLSHNQSKLLNALSIKKYRLQHGKFVVEGEKMVAELLSQTHIGVSFVFGLDSWAEKNAGLIQSAKAPFQGITETELGKVSNLSTPNSVLAVAEIPDSPCDIQLPGRSLCFYLDGIQDPGNLGSILRIADWFGFAAVYCSPDCVDVFNPKVVQASMGAILRVPVWEVTISDLCEQPSTFPVLGAMLDAENVMSAQLPNHGLLVIGNEGKGISTEVMAFLTQRISIPKHPKGGAESLNAAVAAGILAALFPINP